MYLLSHTTNLPSSLPHDFVTTRDALLTALHVYGTDLSSMDNDIEVMFDPISTLSNILDLVSSKNEGNCYLKK